MKFGKCAGLPVNASITIASYAEAVNFESLANAFLTMWVAFIQNNWHVVHQASLAAYPGNSFMRGVVTLFYVSFNVLAIIVVMNIVVSVSYFGRKPC